MITINLNELYTNTAKLSELNHYEQQVLTLAGNGNEITLTGAAPVWLYLRLAHALHGKAIKLNYNSPVTGLVIVFDHNPF
ncbi:MAG: hypothetical protein FE834_01930 [Gammaproteobacteria bacterium]|nr:hypothetical protein [Gammaproteobacteria bacterium]